MLRHLPKRKWIAKFLKKERVKVVCLQETHLNRTESRYLEFVFPGHIYQAPSLGRSDGVMIGIARSLPWVLRDQSLHKVYTPNISQAPFWEEVLKILVLNQDSEILMLGDFNAVFDNYQDRSQASSTPCISSNFLHYKELFGLVDIWRKENEVKVQDYTFFSY